MRVLLALGDCKQCRHHQQPPASKVPGAGGWAPQPGQACLPHPIARPIDATDELPSRCTSRGPR